MAEKLKLETIKNFLMKYINRELNLAIYISLPSSPDATLRGEGENTPIFDGKYLGKIDLPSDWELGYRFKRFNEDEEIIYQGIQTVDGILFTSQRQLQHYSLQPGEKFLFKINYFHLMAWKEIENNEESDPIDWEEYSYAYEKDFLEKF